MPTIGKIKAELLGDTRHFDRNFQRAGRQVRRFESSLEGLRRVILPLTGAVGFGSLIRSTFHEADALGNLARRLGTNVEGFSRLSRVLARSGIGMQQTAMILQRLQRRAADAQDGNKQLSDAFAELGINVDSFIQRDPVDAFLRVADALSQVERPAERIQLAFKLLDSEGVAVLQANLPRLREEMANTTAITDKQSQAIKALADNWARLGENLRSVAAQLAEGVGLDKLVGGLATVSGKLAQPGFVERLARPPGFRHGPLGEMFDQLMALDPNKPPPPAPTEFTRFGGAAFSPGLTNVRTPRDLPGNQITGGLGPSNAILEQLRGIRKNTELKGAVLE